MDIKVNIDPEQVNKAVADAIIKSAIGDKIRDGVQRATAELTCTWQNPIDEAIKAQVNMIVRDVISAPEFIEKIKAHIHEKLTEQMVTELLDAAWKNVHDRLR